MDSSLLETLVLAAQNGTDDPSRGAPGWTTFVPIILIVVMFYVLLIRPQSVRAKEHARMIEQIKVGDRVVTSGGIMGTVLGIRGKNLSIRSSDSKLEILKNSVSEINKEKVPGSGEKGHHDAQAPTMSS